MKTKRILYIDDNECLRNETKEALEKKKWDVDTVTNGKEALARVRSREPEYDVIVLDLRMPEMSGEELLECIQDEQLSVPPIIVLSAYLNHELEQKCRYLGAAHVLKKPYSPADLHEIATAAMRATLTNMDVDFDDSLLDYMVRRRETSLCDLLLTGATAEAGIGYFTEPVLVVGRRWNSWYPSVFPVPGGAYAIIGPPQAQSPGSPRNRRSPVAAIDPGFRFLEVFRNIGIPWDALDCCIITHNHPDHMGGVFELMAVRHALRKKTRVLCSRSCCEMLGDCAGFNLEVKELDEKLVDLFPPYETEERWMRVRVKGIDTAHEEIGRLNTSKGLHFSCESSKSGGGNAPFEQTAELVILGDTEYIRADHRDMLIPNVCGPNVKVVVLHIGSSQFKQTTGKHLYLRGLRSILSDMESQLSVNHHKGRLLVLISEWGLEHATRGQITKICSGALPGFNDFSPMIETIECLQRGLEKVYLMPADIGLVVGTESGMVYDKSGEIVQPEDMKVSASEDGLTYVKKDA